MKEVNNW